MIGIHFKQTKLPIAAQSSIDFVVDIFAEADFICPAVNQPTGSVHSTSYHPYDHSHTLQYASNLATSGQGYLPSRVGSPSQHSATRRNDTAYSSFRSTTSTSTAQHSLATLNLANTDTNFSGNQTQLIEAQFRIKYSGGRAMEEGYCRQCSVYFKLELIQSAQITSWDVLPAEMYV